MDSYLYSYHHPIDCDLTDESLNIDIKEILNLLSERERYIITLFFGINCEEKDLNEIAVKMNITYERVRHIKENAIKKLRRNSELLRSYLG